MIFKVSGSLTSATNYRYVCDVKNGAGTTTLARLKCDKLPTTNYGFFDVQKVVETLMAPTVPTLAQVGFADHAGFYSGYRLTFMEEYGNTPVVQTGTTTNVSGVLAFAGNLEQLELADWSGGTYFPPAPLDRKHGQVTHDHAGRHKRKQCYCGGLRRILRLPVLWQRLRKHNQRRKGAI